MDRVKVSVMGYDDRGYLWMIKRPRRYFGWKIERFGYASTFNEGLRQAQDALQEGIDAAQRI